ncbi:MAG: flagellar basal body P-ring protein FlgI [Cyanobacteriota bacterium]
MFKKVLISLTIAGIILLNNIPACYATRVRIKDISHIDGVRDNQLIGYGIVVGLQGTGDNSRSTQRTNRALLTNLGTIVENDNDIKKGNSAAVILTANIPPFAKEGDQLDVVVSSLADAKSLEGGVLVQTQLLAPNGEVVAIAQGPISTGGVSVSANGSSAKTSITTSGRIPGGAIVERSIHTDLGDDYGVTLVLNRSDFTMAARVAQVVNENLAPAKALDGSTVRIGYSAGFSDDRVGFIAALENLTVETTDAIAKVVVNERTGTIVIGNDVKLLPAAVAHGNITVTVTTQNEVSQPNSFSGGVTTGVSNSQISINKTPGRLIELPANSNLRDLVRALNAIGVTPFDLISILQALKESGSLKARLEIM